MKNSLLKETFAMSMLIIDEVELFIETLKKDDGGSRIRLTSSSPKKCLNYKIHWLEFTSGTDYSRSADEEKAPKKKKLKDGSEVFCYDIFLLKFGETSWITGCKYTSALKEFCIRFVENRIKINYLKPNLLNLRDSFSIGNNLKGKLAVSGVRLDYFGETSSLIEKIFIRGKDVFSSNKLDKLIDALVEGIVEKQAPISWHSIILFYKDLSKTQKVAVDKFGNLRAMLDFSAGSGDSLASICLYLEGYCTQDGVCPLRRESDLPSEPL